MKPNKVKTSETREIKRSQINFAPYNPRTKDEKVIKDIKKNFKKVGYLGGVVWNELTGNLVAGHKRIETMDIINNYDGTIETDYFVKVDVCNLDAKTEMEQNIFMNNPKVQGRFDYQLLAEMTTVIDIENTGLDQNDIDKMLVFCPEIKIGNNEEIINDYKNVEKETKELNEIEKQLKKEELKAVKEKIKEQVFANHNDTGRSHVTLIFANIHNKVAFLEYFNLNPDEMYVNGDNILEQMEE